MSGGRRGHASERFARLLALYRRPDGSEWGGRDLERATGGPEPGGGARTASAERRPRRTRARIPLRAWGPPEGPRPFPGLRAGDSLKFAVGNGPCANSQAPRAGARMSAAEARTRATFSDLLIPPR